MASPKPKPIKRKRVDWDKGDKLILEGRLTNSEISVELNCTEGAVRKRIKDKNLVRDLTGDIQKATRAKLVRNEVRNEQNRIKTDNEVIEEAASVSAQVIISHRGCIAKRRNLVAKLAAEIESLTDGQDEIPDIIKGLKSKDEKVYIAALKKVASMPARIKGLTDLVKADDLLIKMERNAFNISEGEGGEGDEPKSGRWVLECK